MKRPIKEKWKKASKTASQAISTTFFQEFQEWRWRELNHIKICLTSVK